MTKKIISIGVEINSPDLHKEEFSSRASLLDWDIILFRPTISSFCAYSDYYQGKQNLSDSMSFKLRESCEHWRREIKQAIDTGKIVIVFLSPLEDVFIDTGRRSYSGSGRNQQTTRIVEPYNNYAAIPADLSPISASGKEIQIASPDLAEIAAFWPAVSDVSRYNVLLNAQNITPILITKSGNKTIGAIIRSQSSDGALIVLPDIDFYSTSFVKERDGKKYWTPPSRQFAAQFIAAIVALDKALRASSEITPEPQWASKPEFSFKAEIQLQIELLDAEKEVERAQINKEYIADKLRASGSKRALLFEKGIPLERAIIESLKDLGFSASPYKDSTSEFDVVFQTLEGRLIGEAEGKDNKPINIDKLRQLSMNIHEDLQNDDVKSPAKPVLFGNPFRLRPPEDRPDPFTEKCLTAANISNVSLVFTPDLFRAVQYLASQPDAEYANACRSAILSTVGRVKFPDPPTIEQNNTEHSE